MDLDDAAGSSRCERIPIGMVFKLCETPFVEKVIRTALAFRSEAPQMRQMLDQAIRKSVKLNGYRDASRANEKQLEASMLDEIERLNPRLAAAVLRTWSESQAELRALVSGYLHDADVAVEASAEHEWMQDTWTSDEWQKLRAGLLAKHECLDEDEADLMLCLVAKRVPMGSGGRAEQLVSLRFEHWLDELERLPNDALEWGDARLFAHRVAELAQAKDEERINSYTSSLKKCIDDVRKKYKEELQYLGIDMSAWFEQAVPRLATMPEAERIVADLKPQLRAYRPIRPQASLREEEKRRAEVREQCERDILETANAWRQLMSRPLEVADKHEEYIADPNPLAEDASLRQELDDLQARCDKLETENEALQKANARLDAAKANLQLEEAQLSEQIATLKKDLKSSQETGQYWRKAVVNGRRGSAPASIGERVACANVSEAIAQAQQAFADELLFALNSKSDKNQHFQKPDEVFDALAWLATEYRRLRPNPGPLSDFDHLLKQACPGWSYKPNQTDTTMGMYPDWYKASAQGKTYDLANHIGKGTSHDPKNTIRIAFAWDGDRSQVVVGYIGLHQRNRHS